MNEYALYKGEDILAIGTVREIANELNIKEETVRFYGRPAYIKRRKAKKSNNFRELIKL